MMKESEEEAFFFSFWAVRKKSFSMVITLQNVMKVLSYLEKIPESAMKELISLNFSNAKLIFLKIHFLKEFSRCCVCVCMYKIYISDFINFLRN